MPVHPTLVRLLDAPWSTSIIDVASALTVDLIAGLSSDEASQRLDHFGANLLRAPESKRVFRTFLLQFADWMVALLAIAAAVSAAIGEWQDSLLIAVIVLVNATIGFLQEQKAEKAVAALKNLSQPRARVWRDGTLQAIAADHVVPGDLIELTIGSLAPADARIAYSSELQTDEAPLTGESMPVEKCVDAIPKSMSLPERTCMVYAGTALTKGHGRAVLTSTGQQTEIGRIAEMLNTTESVTTPLQEKLAVLSRRIATAVLVLCSIVFLAGLARGNATPQELFLMSVSLAVAAIPEGLPAVFTIALAIGSQRMSRRRAIVRQLAAVETLGSVDVICSDKTGTLTRNQMSVSDVVVSGSRCGP